MLVVEEVDVVFAVVALLFGVPESRVAGIAAVAFAAGRFRTAVIVATIDAVVLAVAYVAGVAAFAVPGEVVAGALVGVF